MKKRGKMFKKTLGTTCGALGLVILLVLAAGACDRGGDNATTTTKRPPLTPPLVTEPEPPTTVSSGGADKLLGLMGTDIIPASEAACVKDAVASEKSYAVALNAQQMNLDEANIVVGMMIGCMPMTDVAKVSLAMSKNPDDPVNQCIADKTSTMTAEQVAGIMANDGPTIKALKPVLDSCAAASPTTAG